MPLITYDYTAPLTGNSSDNFNAIRYVVNTFDAQNKLVEENIGISIVTSKEQKLYY